MHLKVDTSIREDISLKHFSFINLLGINTLARLSQIYLFLFKGRQHLSVPVDFHFLKASSREVCYKMKDSAPDGVNFFLLE